jgi:hypothetical protein
VVVVVAAEEGAETTWMVETDAGLTEAVTRPHSSCLLTRLGLLLDEVRIDFEFSLYFKVFLSRVLFPHIIRAL